MNNDTSTEASALLLGIDIGTGSSKGVLTRSNGEVLGISEQPHDVSMPKPGWAEHDADDIWWADFLAICEELIPQADGPIQAVGLSGIGPCFLAADAEGAPLRPGILYGIDTRAANEVIELTERYGNDEIVARSGNPLNVQSVGPKIEWLRTHEPDVWEKTKHFFMAHTFIGYRLTGAYVLDHVSASLCEPLYDVGKNEWISEWVDEVAPGLPMPELRWPSDIAGYVTAEGADLSGLPEGIPVCVGTTDSFADSLSVGVTHPGDAIIIYGSTMSVVEVTDRSLPSDLLWSNAHLFAGTYNFSTGMATSGSLTKWLRDMIGDIDFGTLTQEAGEVPPGSDGLVILPYFAGERTPLHDPNARGVIVGLTLSHTRGHLYRALLEATAYGCRHLLELMADGGGHAEHGYAVGGGTKGGLWPQIVSDVTGLEQKVPEQALGAAYGDAMMAGLALGTVDREDSWAPIIDVIRPDPKTKAVYDELYAVYRKLHPATVDIQHTLAEMQHR